MNMLLSSLMYNPDISAIWVEKSFDSIISLCLRQGLLPV